MDVSRVVLWSGGGFEVEIFKRNFGAKLVFQHTVENYANLVLDAKFPHIYVKYIANSICIVFIYKYMSGLEYS